jgi:hypothetical protein
MGDSSPEGSFTNSFKQQNSRTDPGMRDRKRRRSLVEGVRRRAMPAQGGEADDRRRTDSVSDDLLDVMISGLWKHHRLIAPSQVYPPKFYWDMVVIVAVMWNCFVVPAELCFRRAALDIETTESGRGFKTFDSVIDLFFFADIVLNFRTTCALPAARQHPSPLPHATATELKSVQMAPLRVRLPSSSAAMLVHAGILTITATSRCGGARSRARTPSNPRIGSGWMRSAPSLGIL